MGSDEVLFRRQMEALEADARLGVEMEKFRGSIPYRYLMAKAELEAMKAAEDLVDCAATDASEICRLQNEVKRLRTIRVWVDEAVDKGLAALDQLEERERLSDD